MKFRKNSTKSDIKKSPLKIGNRHTLCFKPRILHIEKWNDEQLDYLSKAVLDEAGFISTLDESMETKWNRIRNRLINSPQCNFACCNLALWEGLYKQYKEFKRDLISYYEISPETMDFSRALEDLKPWAVLILHMEKYRKITNQVSFDNHI